MYLVTWRGFEQEFGREFWMLVACPMLLQANLILSASCIRNEGHNGLGVEGLGV